MIIFSSSLDKSVIIDLLQSLLIKLLFHGLRIEGQRSVLDHIRWMRAQRAGMQVQCTLETVPEAQATKITVLVNFVRDVRETAKEVH